MTTEGIGTQLVVRNHELQYSLWPADRELPAGWEPEGFSGERQECLDHIEQVWTDMRPLSARAPQPAVAPN
ncbi:MbtH family NRPS accessory protein [Streptomyces sp. NPDC008122]|uniref:MbtH family protein n=1 Tax=Streptomyces sp. NPDC008122 TaxID=3364810 RepID=UPI0036E09B10